MSTKNRKAEQYEHTRRRLLDVAARLFAEQGYAGTGTEEVVRQAGVTRGALYYHFRDKRDLFRAVVEDLQQQALLDVQAAGATAADPWEGLRAGLHAFLDSCLEPSVQRILLIDAPSVLGWAAWRELDAKYGLGLLRAALQGLMDAGLLEPQPIDPLAHMLLGALGEAGMVIAEAEDAQVARRDVGASLDRLLNGLHAPTSR
ncbi:MAG: TetR/AcrR family transcriptional regulator [Dehalococcoidia bacterium]